MKFQRDVSISYTSHLSTFTSNLDTKNVQHTRYNTWLDDYCLAGITDVSEFGGKYSTSRIKFLRATVPNFLFLGATAPTFLFLGATAPNFLFLGATAPNFLFSGATAPNFLFLRATAPKFCFWEPLPLIFCTQ